MKADEFQKAVNVGIEKVKVEFISEYIKSIDLTLVGGKVINIAVSDGPIVGILKAEFEV